MVKERFKLSKLLIIDPGSIIPESGDDNAGAIILTLSIAFNHLKGVMVIHRLFNNQYERPGAQELSGHSGEYDGLNIQLISYTISIVQEFFVLINKNIKVIRSPDFNKYVDMLPSKIKQEWNVLVQIAMNEDRKDTKFTRFLKLIRNNIGFHFNYDLELIKKGYKKHFYQNSKNEANKNAFVSFGKDIPRTRFYFADAAIDSVLSSEMPDNFITEFFGCASSIAQTVSAILAFYIKDKGYTEYISPQSIKSKKH